MPQHVVGVRNRKKQEGVMTKKRIWARVGLAAGVLCCLSACGDGSGEEVSNLASIRSAEDAVSVSIDCSNIAIEKYREQVKNDDGTSTISVRQDLRATRLFKDACRSLVDGKCDLYGGDTLCKVRCEKLPNQEICRRFSGDEGHCKEKIRTYGKHLATRHGITKYYYHHAYAGCIAK
ncbi:MAG: hypothetical protein AAF471_00320 [Myxococcota bacterium]